MNILLAPVFVVVFYLIYKDIFQTKRYELSTYLNESDTEKNSAWFKFTSPISSLTRVILNDRKEQKIQEKLYAAGLDMKPQEFVRLKIIYPTVSTIIFILGVFLSDNPILRLGALLSPLLYFYPDFLLRKRIKRAKLEKKLELPEYLKFLAQLLKSHSVAQAIIKSQDYAGPYLKPHVERLAAEVENYPGSDVPFKNFAKSVDIPEAYTFMVALQQALKTSKKQAIEILNSQIQMLRTLEKENYRFLIQKKPEEMNAYGLILLGGMIIYPLILVIIALSEGFKQI